MVELVLCGRGGQGIVFLTRQIGQIAASKGENVISSETHGMAVRGGSINSHLRIGSFFSPLIRAAQADFLVSLDATETANNKHYLKSGGLIIENSAKKDEPQVRRVDAAGIARELGRVQLENVVMLGYAATVQGFPVTAEEVHSHLARETRQSIRSLNLSALQAGIDAASKGSNH